MRNLEESLFWFGTREKERKSVLMEMRFESLELSESENEGKGFIKGR